MSVWFDARVDRIQRAIDAVLPAECSNRLYRSRGSTGHFFVVLSGSDREPGQYLLYDAERAALQPIGGLRPWIDSATQGTRSFHRVAARDGLPNPVYLTHPPGASPSEPLPAVPLVHGGPYLRGSTLDWAVKQGGVDAGRVCMMGGSYGGYAALMAPISHPSVFRCAVAFAVVTDLHLMYSAEWSDLSEAAKRYSMPVLIGDPVKDEKRLNAASPLLRAAEIKVPVLLGHGEFDQHVPSAHSNQFLRAAREGGVAVTCAIASSTWMTRRAPWLGSS